MGLKNPFEMPGMEFLKSSSLNPSTNKDIFQKPKGGGGARPKPKPQPEPEPEIEQIPNEPPPPPPQEPPVKLFNLKWSVESAHFEDKVSVFLDVDLPDHLNHLTRVIVTVFAVTSDKSKDQIKAKDLYVKDGKVSGEFTLHRPAKKDNQEVESCPFIFTAKHRDSKEIESPRLQVSDKPRGNDELILEFTRSEELKTSGYVFHLKSKDGSIDSKFETKNGQEKEGTLTLKFSKLDPKLEYTLDMLNAQGKVIESIFPKTLFGKWAEGVK